MKVNIIESDPPQYEQATEDDPHPGELYRYPVDWMLRVEMVMYRGGETWMRDPGQPWQLLRPWRVPQPAQH